MTISAAPHIEQAFAVAAKSKKRRGRPPGAKNAPPVPRDEVQQIVPAACRACEGTNTKVIYSNTVEYLHEFQGRNYSRIVKQKHQCRDCSTITWADVHK